MRQYALILQICRNKQMFMFVRMAAAIIEMRVNAFSNRFRCSEKEFLV